MTDAKAAASSGVQDAARGSRAAFAFGWAALFWSAFGIFAAVQTYLSMMSHGHSLVRLIVYQLIVCLFWAAAFPVIAFLARRFPLAPWRWRSTAVHAAAAAGFATAFIAWDMAMNLAIRPYDIRNSTQFAPGFKQLLEMYFLLEILVYLGTVGVVYAIDFHRRSSERAVRAADLERELAQARLDALAIQLQPHFLFNALHTVAGLVRGGEPQAAITTIAGLSDLLRYALDTTGSPTVTLREEMEAMRRYLAIQELRYGGRLAVTLEVDPETLAATLPRLLLQPLVENAIRHGVAMNGRGPWLTLRTSRRDGDLHVEIQNSAHEQPNEPGLGIGLSNTRARLAQLYGETYRLETRRLADRFELTLAIPWRPAVPDA